MKKFIISLLFLTLLLISINDTLAQATRGKIAGRVIDKATSEPLPGASVLIAGTSIGAATDVDGYYFILNVHPGVYTITAQMMGYTSQSVSDVQVNVGRTSEVDFTLAETILEGEVVYVSARKEGIRKDVSNSASTMASNVVEMIPSKNAEDLMTNVAGVTQDMYGLVIRGGYEDEIGFVVDGVSMNDERTNRPYTQINMGMVSEVEVLTGGFNAEYGNARSGIVNVVTKKPTKRYTGSFDYKNSPAALKHFGPNAWSNEDWWDWGRF